MLWSWRLAGVAGGMVAVVVITMNDSGLLWDSKVYSGVITTRGDITLVQK